MVPSEVEAMERKVAETIQEAGYQLVEFQFIPQKKNLLIRMAIHKPGGGISHDDCSYVDSLCGPVFEQYLEEGFGLEVSSPGLGRKLKTLREREIFQNMPVHILLKKDPGKKITGILGAQTEEQVSVIIQDKAMTWPLDEILKIELA